MTEGNGLSPEVADVFARGLYFLANVDGIEEREERLIKEFLSESGASIEFGELKDSKFDPLEAAMALQTHHMRQFFIKAAVALVKADGVYSDAERHAVGQVADAFGMSNAEFGDLEQAAVKDALE